ncbi:MAG: hypothetical protein N2F24_15895, partial [Deltaproteobacteria bacterium]
MQVGTRIASVAHMTRRALPLQWLSLVFYLFTGSGILHAQEAEPEIPMPVEALAEVPVKEAKTFDEKINDFFEPATDAVNTIVFFNIYTSAEKKADGKPVLGIPFILVWLG